MKLAKAFPNLENLVLMNNPFTTLAIHNTSEEIEFQCSNTDVDSENVICQQSDCQIENHQDGECTTEILPPINENIIDGTEVASNVVDADSIKISVCDEGIASTSEDSPAGQKKTSNEPSESSDVKKCEECNKSTFSCLVALNLSGTRITGWSQLEKLKHFPTLREVRLKDIPFLEVQ